MQADGKQVRVTDDQSGVFLNALSEVIRNSIPQWKATPDSNIQSAVIVDVRTYPIVRNKTGDAGNPMRDNVSLITCLNVYKALVARHRWVEGHALDHNNLDVRPYQFV